MKYKYKNIYLFLVVLSFMGCLFGYKYSQSLSEKEYKLVDSSINVNNVLKRRVNNVGNSFLFCLKIFLLSIIFIGIFYNLYFVFFISFCFGFLLNYFIKFKFLFSLFYLLIYYFIPYIFLLFLIKISFTISKELLKLILKKKNKFKNIVLKYLIIGAIFNLYNLIVFFISSSINSFLTLLL